MRAVRETQWANRVVERAERRGGNTGVGHSAAIMEAARELLLTRSEGFTMEELVREAGVGLPTVYRHFGSKDDLMVAVLDDLIAESAREYEAAVSALADPLERLEAILRAMLATLSFEAVARYARSEFLRLQQTRPGQMVQVVEPVVQLIQRTIGEAEAKGLIAPQDPRRDAELIAEMAITQYHRHAGSTEWTPHQIADHFAGFVLHGLRAR